MEGIEITGVTVYTCMHEKDSKASWTDIMVDTSDDV